MAIARPEEEGSGAMVVVDGKAIFDSDLEAFENWCFFLPKGPCEDVDNMGEYVKWRGIRNPSFFDATLRRLKELMDSLQIESKTSTGLRPETLLSAKWSCLEAQGFVVGFTQNRQLRKAQILAEEALNLMEFCCGDKGASTGGLMFLRALCRMELGLVYRHARRYADAVSLLSQNLALGHPVPGGEAGDEASGQVGPKEMILIGACHAQLQFTHMASSRQDLAADHARLAVEIFEAHLWRVPSDDKDAPQKAAILAAAYGNAGVLAIQQEDVETGLEWLGKARATLEELKGVQALRDTIRDQYDHASTLRRYQIGDDAKAEVPREGADGESSSASVENSS